MADAPSLRIVLVGVGADDIARLRRTVAGIASIRVVDTTSIDAAGATRPSEAPHDAVLLTAEAAARLPRVAAAPPPRVPAPEALTPRERDVLALAADGRGNRAIAGLLGISEHTVKFHLASIYGKLDVGNRTAAVQRALRLGALEI